MRIFFKSWYFSVICPVILMVPIIFPFILINIGKEMEEKNNPDDVHAKKPFLWAQKSSRKLSFSLVSHLCHRE
jgi:hypothetical protein